MAQATDEEREFIYSRCGLYQFGHKIFWCGPYRDAAVIDEVQASIIRCNASRPYARATASSSSNFVITLESFTVTRLPDHPHNNTKGEQG